MKKFLILSGLIIAILFSHLRSFSQVPDSLKNKTGIKIRGGNNPVFVLDGIKQSPIYDVSALNVDPKDIESITVLKNANAITLYGIEAINGAVLITTKAGKSSKTNLELEKRVKELDLNNPNKKNDQDIDQNITQVVLRGLNKFDAEFAKNIIYIIDGKEISYEDFKGVNMESVKSISVIKDAASTALYGERASKGVIVITTKDQKSDSKTDKN